MENTKIKTGQYRHYKGGLYEVVGTAFHSETLEEMVIYKRLYGDQTTWVRPFGMFFEKIEFEGKLVDRFKEI